MITLSIFELAFIVIGFGYLAYVIGVVHSYMVNRMDDEEKNIQLDAYRKMIVRLSTVIEGISKTMNIKEAEELEDKIGEDK